MAPYKQQPQSHGSSSFGSVNRGGGSNNGGRGNGKKDRSGYNSNNWSGNGSSNGNNDYHNNWRAPSYGNGSYGPGAFPTTGNYPQRQPQVWGAQYSSSYPNPTCTMGSFLPTNEYNDSVSTMGFRSHSASADNVLPLRNPSYSTTLASNTPIATPALSIAMPAPQPAGSTLLDKKNIVSDTTATESEEESSQADKVEAQPQDADTTVGDSAYAKKSSRTHIYAPAPHRPAKFYAKRYDAPGVPPLLLGPNRGGYLPREGQTPLIDQLPQTIQKAFEGLANRDLSELRVLECSQAARFQKTLVDASVLHQSQEASQQEHRANLLDHLIVLRESEKRHEHNIRYCQDAVARQMTESLKMVGDAKDAAQRKAIDWLKTATAESRVAAERREALENCRKELFILDNVRALAATSYAVAIQQVVTEALDCVKAKVEAVVVAEDGKDGYAKSTSPAKTSIEAKEVAKTASEEEVLNNRQTLRASAQQVIQQPVFETQSATKHQSVDDVSGSIKSTDQSIGLRRPEEKHTSAAQDGQSKSYDRPTPKPSKTPEPYVSKKSKKKGKDTGQEPRPTPSEAARKTQHPVNGSRQPTPKFEEKLHSESSQKVDHRVGAKQSKKKGRTADQEPKSELHQAVTKTQEPAFKVEEPIFKTQESKTKPQTTASRIHQQPTSKVSEPASETPKFKFELQTPTPETQDFTSVVLKPVTKAEEPTLKPEEKVTVESTKISQPLQTTFMNVSTEHGTIRQLAVSLNGHTITDPTHIANLLEGDLARKDSVATEDIQDDVKNKNDTEEKGKRSTKEDDMKAVINSKPQEKVEDPFRELLVASLASVNSPASVKPAKSKNKSKKKKKKAGGAGQIGGEGMPGSGTQTPAGGEIRKGG